MRKRIKYRKLKKKLNYKFYEYLVSGAFAQFIMLFIAIIFVVVLFGILVNIIVEDKSANIGIWQSLMHIIDQGTITGDETSNTGYVVLMFIVTVFGMIFTGTLIGIINNALREKLDDLKRGVSEIVEEGHLIILGFNDNIYCLLKQQMLANENWEGNKGIVIIDKYSTEDMEQKIKIKLLSEQENTPKSAKSKKSKLIYRTGNLASSSVYELLALDKAKAVIINKEDDFEIIQIILALKTFLKEKGIYQTKAMPNIITLIHNKENLAAARIAGEVNIGQNNAANKVQILYFEDVMAHIFAQVCRQPGLFKVFSEIFDYDGSEIYIEDKVKSVSLSDMGLVGKEFCEINHMLVSSVALGIRRRNGNIILVPAPDTKFEKGDSIIHLAMDDNEIEISSKSLLLQGGVFGSAGKGVRAAKQQYHILIFGWNIPLPNIIESINVFALSGSDIKIVSDEPLIDRELIPRYTNLEIFYEEICPYDWKKVRVFLDREFQTKKITNILLLCQDNIDKIEADQKNTVLLLNIRAYLKEYDPEKTINITSEMNQVETQELLQDTETNDFIVGSEITNRIMVQIANNTDLYRIFHTLLNAGGLGINLRYMEDYVDITKPFSFRYLCDNMIKGIGGKREIPIGWIKYSSKGNLPEVQLNPKSVLGKLQFEANEFNRKDKLIVLSSD